MVRSLGTSGKIPAFPVTSLKQLRRFVVLAGRRRAAEELVGLKSGLSAAGGADQELLAEQERLDFVAKGIDGQVQGGAEGLDAGRAAAEHIDQHLQVSAILLVQAFGIDLGHGEGGAGEIER